MITAGLTGNIGSGKTMVSSIFNVLGIPVYHADQESKKFLGDDAVRRRILEFFGQKVFTGEGEIDRKALAGIVFNDAAALRKLNDILHPLVRDDFREWTSHRSGCYVIHEAAVIIESGFRNEFDQIIHVSCPAGIAIDRVTLRDSVSRDEVLRRMQFQMEDEKKAALSDFVIRNDGSEMVIPQVLAIHHKLLNISQ
ncbi:MAG: dephospho-CoA kinase [bacterium]